MSTIEEQFDRLERAGVDGEAQLRALIDAYELPVELAEWLVDQKIAGRSDAEILAELPFHPAVQEAFPELAASREAGQPMALREIVEYRRATRQLFHSYGMPSGFYDDPSDFAGLIRNRWSVTQLERAVVEGFHRVASSSTEVREWAAREFGASGDVALAMVFLDPTKGVERLVREAHMAEIGGTGARFGFDVSKAMADRLVSLGPDIDPARAFSQLARLRPVLAGRLGERAIGDDEASSAVFGQDTAAIERRAEATAASLSGGGGVAVTGRGLAV